MIERYRYDAFGTPTIFNGSNQQITVTAYKNRFLFTGREYIKEFGIYEYRARTYNPVIGRFMSEDPKGFDAGDYNLFRYCHNDPEDLTDPMGLAWSSEFGMNTSSNFSIGGELQRLAMKSASMGWVSGNSEGLTMGQMDQVPETAGTLGTLHRAPGRVYGSFTEAGKSVVSSNWDKAKNANQDAKHLQEHNYPVGQMVGYTKGHYIVGNLIVGDIARGQGTGNLGFHVKELAANLPQGARLVGYATIHPNSDFERKVVGHDVGVVNRFYGIQPKVYYQAPRSITNWSRYDAGRPSIIDN